MWANWFFSRNIFAVKKAEIHPKKKDDCSVKNFRSHSNHVYLNSVHQDGVWRLGRGVSPDRVRKTRFTSSESSTGDGLPPQTAPKQRPANGPEDAVRFLFPDTVCWTRLRNTWSKHHWSRARKPWSANCELKQWNFGGEKCLIHGLHFTV